MFYYSLSTYLRVWYFRVQPYTETLVCARFSLAVLKFLGKVQYRRPTCMHIISSRMSEVRMLRSSPQRSVDKSFRRFIEYLDIGGGSWVELT